MKQSARSLVGCFVNALTYRLPAGSRGTPAPDTAVVSPAHLRYLTVVPLIAYQRYYGEVTVR